MIAPELLNGGRQIMELCPAFATIPHNRVETTIGFHTDYEITNQRRIQFYQIILYCKNYSKVNLRCGMSHKSNQK